MHLVAYFASHCKKHSHAYSKSWTHEHKARAECICRLQVVFVALGGSHAALYSTHFVRHVSRRVIRFTGIRRALWGSLVCHGNPETAVPLAVRFSRFVGPDLALFYALARNVHVCIIWNRGSRACAYTHTRTHTHKDIGVANPRKNSVVTACQRNATYNYLEYDTLHVSAICVYRQITVSTRRGAV